MGNAVKLVHPTAYLVGPDGVPVAQHREEVFTSNAMGQTTTHTDANGNVKVFVRYPLNDPEGAGSATPGLSTQQYGLLKEMHVDANPAEVMSLVGAHGDLLDFISPPPVASHISRPGTEGAYLDLVTNYERGSLCHRLRLLRGRDRCGADRPMPSLR